MTKTLIKSRYKPKYKHKSEREISKENTSTSLPSNLLNFKQKLLSGSGFKTYKYLNMFNYNYNNTYSYMDIKHNNF